MSERWPLFVKARTLEGGRDAACGCPSGTPCVINLRWTGFICCRCFGRVDLVTVGTVEIPFMIDASGRPDAWKLGLFIRLQESYALAAEYKEGELLSFSTLMVGRG